MFSSERATPTGAERGSATRRCGPALTAEAAAHLPDWTEQVTPHVLRHFCASQLYLGGMSLFAIQETLGHAWVATTMNYINPRELHQTGEFVLVG